MSVLAKLVTASKLAAHGDFGAFGRRLRINAAQWRLRRHGGRAFVHRDPGFPFVCHPDWSDSVDQFCTNAGDHWEFAILRQWLTANDTTIDVGASLGLYTFAAAATVGSGGRVVAVEAAPYVHRKLGESAALVGAHQVIVIHAAVTATPGSVTFYVRQDGFDTSDQSLRPTAEQRARSTEVRVPAITLAQLDSAHVAPRAPALVKIDIEGAENLALSAAPAPWLTVDGPLWLLEIHPGALARFGAAPGDIIGRFPPDQFERWLLAKRPLAPGVTENLCALPDAAAIAAADFGRSLYYNFFAVPKGAQWRVRADRIRPLFERAAR